MNATNKKPHSLPTGMQRTEAVANKAIDGCLGLSSPRYLTSGIRQFQYHRREHDQSFLTRKIRTPHTKSIWLVPETKEVYKILGIISWLCWTTTDVMCTANTAEWTHGIEGILIVWHLGYFMVPISFILSWAPSSVLLSAVFNRTDSILVPNVVDCDENRIGFNELLSTYVFRWTRQNVDYNCC